MPRAILAALRSGRIVLGISMIFALAQGIGCSSGPVGGRYLAEGSGRLAPYIARPAAPEMRLGADVQVPPVVPVPPVPLGEGNAARGAALVSNTRPQPAILPAAAFAPAPVPSPPNPATIRQIYQQASAAYAGIDSYIARLTRREVVNSKCDGEEIILFKFRKEPWSVYFKWLGNCGKGREVVYVKGQLGGQIHTIIAAGDNPFMAAGSRMKLAPDSVFVRMASRHPITEAGIGPSIERLGVLIDAVEHGETRRGTLANLGSQQRPDYEHPLTIIEHTLPPGADPALPRGGKRLYGFDPENHLPVLVTTRDDKGQEVEYYRYDRLQFPVNLDSRDFDPDQLWGKGSARAARTP